MYESPIELLVTEIQHQIVKQQDEEIYKAVLNYVPNVDKEELIRALQYDRGQYEKGYADAKAESGWISVKDRLPIEEAKAHEQEWCEEYCEFLVMIERGLLPTTLYYDWENNEWFRINTALERETYKVTHWMPLPEAPKGE